MEIVKLRAYVFREKASGLNLDLLDFCIYWAFLT